MTHAHGDDRPMATTGDDVTAPADDALASADVDGPAPISAEHAALIAERGHDPLDDDQWPATGRLALGLGVGGLLLAVTWVLVPVSGVMALFGLGMGLRARRILGERGQPRGVAVAAIAVNAVLVVVMAALVVWQVASAPLID